MGNGDLPGSSGRLPGGGALSPGFQKMTIVGQVERVRGRPSQALRTAQVKDCGSGPCRQLWWAWPLCLLHPPNPSTSLFLQEEPDLPEPGHGGDLGECFFPLSNTAMSSGPENFLCEMEAISFSPVRSWLKHESSQGEGSAPHPLPTCSPQPCSWAAASEATG